MKGAWYFFGHDSRRWQLGLKALDGGFNRRDAEGAEQAKREFELRRGFELRNDSLSELGALGVSAFNPETYQDERNEHG